MGPPVWLVFLLVVSSSVATETDTLDEYDKKYQGYSLAAIPKILGEGRDSASDASYSSSSLGPDGLLDQSSSSGEAGKYPFSARMMSSYGALFSSGPQSTLSSVTSSDSVTSSEVTASSRNTASMAAPVGASVGVITGGFLAKQGWDLHERVRSRKIFLRYGPRPRRIGLMDPETEELGFELWQGVSAVWSRITDRCTNRADGVQLQDTQTSDIIHFISIPAPALIVDKVSTATNEGPAVKTYEGEEDALKTLVEGRVYVVLNCDYEYTVPSKRVYLQVPNTQSWKTKLAAKKAATNLFRSVLSEWKENAESASLSSIMEELFHNHEGVSHYFAYSLRKTFETIFNKYREMDSLCLSEEKTSALLTEIGENVRPSTLPTAHSNFLPDDLFEHLRDDENYHLYVLNHPAPLFMRAVTPWEEHLHVQLPDTIKEGDRFSITYDDHSLAVTEQMTLNLRRIQKAFSAHCIDNPEVPEENIRDCICSLTISSETTKQTEQKRMMQEQHTEAVKRRRKELGDKYLNDYVFREEVRKHRAKIQRKEK